MPKPFRFNLQKVLDYRAQLEDQAKLALSKAQAAHEDAKRLVEVIAAMLLAQREALAAPQGLSAADIWLGRNYERRLKDDLALAQGEEARLARDVQQRRHELVERAKDRKLLEKLKETQAARHEREENLKEQAGFDEMATLRYKAPAF